MSDQAKPSDLKGLIKRDTSASISDMNHAIREQGAAAGLISREDYERTLQDANTCSETHRSIADIQNDADG